MDKDGAKYVGYAQNAVNCGVDCVYFATHTTHILKDLDFAFPSFAASGSFHIKWTPLRPAKSPIWLKIGYVVLMTHTNKK